MAYSFKYSQASRHTRCLECFGQVPEDVKNARLSRRCQPLLRDQQTGFQRVPVGQTFDSACHRKRGVTPCRARFMAASLTSKPSHFNGPTEPDRPRCASVHESWIPP